MVEYPSQGPPSGNAAPPGAPAAYGQPPNPQGMPSSRMFFRPFLFFSLNKYFLLFHIDTYMYDAPLGGDCGVEYGQPGPQYGPQYGPQPGSSYGAPQGVYWIVSIVTRSCRSLNLIINTLFCDRLSSPWHGATSYVIALSPDHLKTRSI